jgi:hypothetical protein
MTFSALENLTSSMLVPLPSLARVTPDAPILATLTVAFILENVYFS